MKKVIVLAYFFPPNKLVAAERAKSWANYFNEKGIYPIIVTRKWESATNSLEGIYNTTSKAVKIESFETYEVHQLPFHANNLENIFLKFKDTKLSLLYLFIRFFNGVLNKWFNFPIPFNNFYSYTKVIIEKENIYSLIVSAYPFMMFKFGYQLKKDFPKLKWLADYRDDWTSNALRPKPTIIHKLFNRFESIYEKKWVSSAEIVTSVTKQYTKNVAEISNRKGFLIYNGFEKSNFNNSYTAKQKESFTLLYSGTLYHNQKIEMAFEGIKNLNKTGYNVKMKMPGATLNKEVVDYLNDLIKGHENEIQVFDRLESKEFELMKNNCDALLLTAYGNLKHVIPAKLFEYIGTGKTIIMLPSDNGEIAEILSALSNTYILNDVSAFEETIIHLMDENNEQIYSDEEIELRNFYSRKQQAFKMAELVKKYL